MSEPRSRKVYGFVLLLTILGILIVYHQFLTAKEEIQNVLITSEVTTSNELKIKRIVCISDTHGKHEELKLPTGDILVHLGDFSKEGKNIKEFISWFEKQPHEHKILVLGTSEANPKNLKEPLKEVLNLIKQSPSITLLQDEEKIISGIKFYGSSWQSQWKDKGFYQDKQEIEKKWKKIPKDTKVLLTHTPSFGPLKDEILLKEVYQIQPMIHFFGQIHSGKNGNLFTSYLAGTTAPETIFIKVSICDENNTIINKPIVADVHN
eukprot:gene12753-7029_t